VRPEVVDVFAKRAVLWLLTAAIPFVIAACYGVYTGFVRGRVVDAQTGQPVQGIQVDATSNRENPAAGLLSSALTDADGAFEVPVSTYIVFEDVDGEQNGGLYATESFDANEVPTEVPLDKQTN
jgi:putative lipoprotein (rSAM/lipoprotein system)